MFSVYTKPSLNDSKLYTPMINITEKHKQMMYKKVERRRKHEAFRHHLLFMIDVIIKEREVR